MDKYKVTLTFTEPLLGAVPKDKDIYASYIATRAAKRDDLSPEQLEDVMDEEINSVEHLEEKGWTGFHTLNGPFLYEYVLKGFFKDACGMLRRVPGTRSKKITAYKKIIDGLVFVHPRRIYLDLSDDLFVIERPLRGQTAQGERVALARSDAAPAGTMIEFTVSVLGQVIREDLEEWLDYGSLRGLGAWRNASWGRFEYKIEEIE